MVSIQNPKSFTSISSSSAQRNASILIGLSTVGMILFISWFGSIHEHVGHANNSSHQSRRRLRSQVVFLDHTAEKDYYETRRLPNPTTTFKTRRKKMKNVSYECPYTSLNDLTPEERFPKAGTRYIVDPPADTTISLVCCQTTAGPWNIAVHHSWSPYGAQRFLEMVTTQYFSHTVPLMRCVDSWVCQYGLAGEYSNIFAQKIPDDPQWLPAEEVNNNNAGVKRFQKGMFGYSGGGPRTRGRQLFVAMKESSRLGASGKPWEVPWGELVGKHSYDTLDDVYTGYGEDGPSQDLLVEPGGLEMTKRDFPMIDWILSCDVVDEVNSDKVASE